MAAKNKTYTLNDILAKAAFEAYGGLIPEGELRISPVYLSWTNEIVLGRLKRAGIIRHWKQLLTEKTSGNMRAYEVVMESKFL